MKMSSAVAPAAETRSLNEFERLSKMFYAPSEGFADIKRKSLWVWPFVVMAIFSWVYGGVVAKQIGFTQAAANQIRLAPESQRQQMEQAPPEQRAKMEQVSIRITKVITYGFPVISLAWLMIVAVVLWGTFNFGLGRELTYNQSLSILMYASIVGIIKLVVAIITLFVGVDPENFFMQVPVGSTPAYFMSIADNPRWLYSLAASIDIFVLWTLVLTAIGFSVVGKVKRSTAFTVVFGWYFLVVAVQVSWAAIMG